MTAELLANLRTALPGEPYVQIDDEDCDGNDRARVTASFEELRESLVKRGFTLVDPDATGSEPYP